MSPKYKYAAFFFIELLCLVVSIDMNKRFCGFDIGLGYIQAISLVQNLWTNLGSAVIEGAIS
jgi:hypothetical protein